MVNHDLGLQLRFFCLTILLILLGPNIISAQNPPELVSFSAILDPVLSRVDLFWTFGFTDRFQEFNVQRKTATNPSWTTIDVVETGDCAVCLLVYTSTDTVPRNNMYYYRLEIVKHNGGSTYSEEVRVDHDMQKSYVLNQNYPNPFNSQTTISYWLEKPSMVTLIVYNILGREVYTSSAYQTSGTQQIIWNGKSATGTDIASGFYFYRLIVDDGLSPIRKMVVLR
jgi:hypothetical protein